MGPLIHTLEDCGKNGIRTYISSKHLTLSKRNMGLVLSKKELAANSLLKGMFAVLLSKITPY